MSVVGGPLFFLFFLFFALEVSNGLWSNRELKGPSVGYCFTTYLFSLSLITPSVGLSSLPIFSFFGSQGPMVGTIDVQLTAAKPRRAPSFDVPVEWPPC